MSPAAKHRTDPAPWLRPGQRFHQEGASSPQAGDELTIARLVEDPMGMIHAVLRDQSGREFSTYADQIRFAVEVGMLSPMDVGTSGIPRQA